MSTRPIRQKVRNLFHKRNVNARNKNSTAETFAASTGEPTPANREPLHNVSEGEEFRRSGINDQPEDLDRPDNGDLAGAVHHSKDDDHRSQANVHDVADIENEIRKLEIDETRSGAASQTGKVGGSAVLKNAKFTTVHEECAPPVIHETVRRDVHEIYEERIQREIHEHHIVTHILPVIDVEMSAPRHIIRGDDGVEHEVSEAEAADWEKSQRQTQTSVHLVTTHPSVKGSAPS